LRGRGAFICSLAAGFLLVVVSLYGFVLFCRRPSLPPGIPKAGVVRIDGIEIRSEHHLNYALSWKQIGSNTDIVVQTPGGGERRVAARLVPYYAGSAYPLICFLTGMLTVALGFLAFILKPQDSKARLFFWLTLAFAAALLINSEEYGLRPGRWITFPPATVFILSYALAPALLLHFSLSFSPPAYRIPRVLIYIPGLVFAAVQIGSFLSAHVSRSLRALQFYSDMYLFFRLYMAVFLSAAVVHLFLAYRKSQEEEPRSQIKWILFGLAAGLTPFVFFYQMPRALGLAVRLPEEVSNIFFIALPVGMAIAIIRYRLVDISKVINRSLVYSLLTVSVVGIYLIVVLLTRGLFARLVPLRREMITAGGVFLAALAFQPAQRQIQNFVDRAFFRQRYDYRRLVFEFADRARHFATADALLGYFLRQIRRALLAERLGVEVALKRSSEAGGDVLLRQGDPLKAELPIAPPGRKGIKVWAKLAAVQAADLVDTSGEKSLERGGLDLVLALPLSAEAGRGRMGLGRLKSERRFSREDIELLRTLAAEMCVHLERIILQEQVIYERASREKLDELNKLKTEFISSVSHELRTPMSAIRGLAEVLQAGKVRSREQREKYLDLMVSESGRLSRFIHNVLDFGRIERQVKTYSFRKTDLKGLVEDAVNVLRGALEEQGFRIVLRLPGRAVERSADPDAVKQAVINLLDNAMKYSAGRKEIEIELREGENVEILVRDRGIGVSPEDKDRIFGAFYRAESAARQNPVGAGLGLKIVRHIMEAHGGEVRVESEIGAGSTFCLVFPKP